MENDNFNLLDYKLTRARRLDPTNNFSNPGVSPSVSEAFEITPPHLDVFSNMYTGSDGQTFGSLGLGSEYKSPSKQELSPLIEQQSVRVLNSPIKPESKPVNTSLISGIDKIKGLIDLFKKEGINVKITSWERPNNKSKAGSRSHHITGSAMDIVPGDGETWESLKAKIKLNKNVYDYLINNGLGILDETLPSVLKKTGGTGPHWHIGPDKIALSGRDVLFDKSIIQKNDNTRVSTRLRLQSLQLPQDSKLSQNSNEIKHTKFESKDIPHFTKVMTKVYSDVLDEMNLPKANLINLVKLAALESSYGVEPRGNGYNLGGIKNFTGDDNKGTVHSGDNINYLNFEDLMDFARYKVKLLNEKYGALTASSIEEFVDRLHGNNPEGRNYSASKGSYMRNLNNMRSLDKAFEELEF